MPTPEFLNKRQLKALIGLSYSSIYRLEKRGLFPGRIELSTNRVAYKFQEVIQWMEARQRRQKGAGSLNANEGTVL